MIKKASPDPADFIMPLNMNGMKGRMLNMPASANKKREILFVYGHHALLERWWGLAQNFNSYGSVTVPDLPGFGGMDSFYKIGKKPTIDNYADYLASFIKMHYKKRRITIAGISFGFVVVTRMLQRYPELAKRVDVVISIVGFMHKDDFLFKVRNRKIFTVAAKIFSTWPVAMFIRYGCLNGLIIKKIYVRLPMGRRRFLEMDAKEFSGMMDFEVQLWQVNDVRTHWATTHEFLSLDNCHVRVELPVWHVASKHDHYFNNHLVKQHMLVVFAGFEEAFFNSKAHTPSILADKKELAVMLPTKLRRVLSKQ